MAKSNTKMKYDQEEDILSLSKNIKIKASIDIGDFIIDIDHKGFVVGMEILNASQTIRLTESQLSSLERASMSISYKPNYLLITLLLKLKEKEKDISIPLTIDLGHNSVKIDKMTFAAVTC
jgi:uncharacterized protein YuzE